MYIYVCTHTHTSYAYRTSGQGPRARWPTWRVSLNVLGYCVNKCTKVTHRARSANLASTHTQYTDQIRLIILGWTNLRPRAENKVRELGVDAANEVIVLI